MEISFFLVIGPLACFLFGRVHDYQQLVYSTEPPSWKGVGAPQTLHGVVALIDLFP